MGLVRRLLYCMSECITTGTYLPIPNFKIREKKEKKRKKHSARPFRALEKKKIPSKHHWETTPEIAPLKHVAKLALK